MPGLRSRPEMLSPDGSNPIDSTPIQSRNSDEIVQTLSKALKYVTKSKKPSAPKVTVTPFGGRDDEDPHHFEKRFRILSESQQWEDKEAIKYMPLYLEDAAERWFDNLAAADLRDLDRVFELLTDKFKCSLTLSKIQEIRMKGEESVGDYTSRFYKTFRRGKATYGESVLMDLYISGLTLKLQEMVVSGGPRSLEAAETLAKKCYSTICRSPPTANNTRDEAGSLIRDLIAQLSVKKGVEGFDSRNERRDFRPRGRGGYFRGNDYRQGAAGNNDSRSQGDEDS